MRRIKPVPRAATRAATSPVWAALARARRWGGTSSSSEAPAKASACSAMSSSSSLRPLRPPGTAICCEECLGLSRRAFGMVSRRKPFWRRLWELGLWVRSRASPSRGLARGGEKKIITCGCQPKWGYQECFFFYRRPVQARGLQLRIAWSITGPGLLVGA